MTDPNLRYKTPHTSSAFVLQNAKSAFTTASRTKGKLYVLEKFFVKIENLLPEVFEKDKGSKFDKNINVLDLIPNYNDTTKSERRCVI